MLSFTNQREKSSTGPSIDGFGFIPKGALRKTVGCPQEPEAK